MPRTRGRGIRSLQERAIKTEGFRMEQFEELIEAIHLVTDLQMALLVQRWEEQFE